MAKANRECYTCSSKYYYCPNCQSGIKKGSYYNMFCSERCSKIFKTLTNETFKHITTEQCKEELGSLNVKLSESFKDSIKKHIEKVMRHGESLIEKIEDIKIEENSDEQNTAENELANVENSIIVDASTEENEIKKIKYATKKRNKRLKNSEVDFKMSE